MNYEYLIFRLMVFEVEISLFPSLYGRISIDKMRQSILKWAHTAAAAVVR
jgi:hypothetical protein